MEGKIKARICFASLICVLAILFTSCDFRLKSKREVEKYLEKQYGQEFTVLSSESVTDDYYDDDVWMVRAYTVSPKDDPETQFFVFNKVEGESFGVPGFRNGLQDTYSLDIFGKAFEIRAADTDVQSREVIIRLLFSFVCEHRAGFFGKFGNCVYGIIPSLRRYIRGSQKHTLWRDCCAHI